MLATRQIHQHWTFSVRTASEGGWCRYLTGSSIMTRKRTKGTLGGGGEAGQSSKRTDPACIRIEDSRQLSVARTVVLRV